MRLRPAIATLPEIECLEKLEKFEREYAERFGVPPFNLSHWDPSPEFEREMTRHLEIPPLQSVIAYTFSYQIKNTADVLAKLGASDLHRGVITPSNSTSILCVLNWIRSYKKKKIVALCPSYFTLFQAGNRFGIPIQAAHLKRAGGTFQLPDPNSAIWREPAVLWITSPVYGAGGYFESADLRRLESLLKNGWTVVADECLSLPGREMVRTLGEYPNFVSIYSPHKGVCVNGLKFSVVVFSKRYQVFMERWCDVWYGGLGTSSLLALSHYLSDNFDQYALHFLRSVGRQRSLFNKVSEKLGVEIDSKAEGHFVSSYFPRISSKLGYSQAFLKTLMDKTGAAIISGNRARYSRDFGLCFRVNLARRSPQFEGTLHRTLAYLTAAGT